MRVLSRMWQMLLKGITEAQGATRPAAAAEMVLVRIAYVADLPTPDEAIRIIEQNGGASSAIVPSAAPRGTPAPTMSSVSALPVRAQAASRPEASIRPQVAASAEPQTAPVQKINSFPLLVALAGEKRDLLTKAALEADVRLVRIEDGRLEVALEPNASRTMINELSRKLEQWTGRRWTVIVSNKAGEPTLRQQNLAKKNERERAAEADARVKEVFARFPGARIVEVRRLAAEPPESDVNAGLSEDVVSGDDAPDIDDL
jgi:DNA polymerase-3 subunit gamma/tau